MQREVVDAFDLQILYDKAQQQVEVSATVSEAVADAFDDGKDRDVYDCSSQCVTRKSDS